MGTLARKPGTRFVTVEVEHKNGAVAAALGDGLDDRQFFFIA